MGFLFLSLYRGRWFFISFYSFLDSLVLLFRRVRFELDVRSELMLVDFVSRGEVFVFEVLCDVGCRVALVLGLGVFVFD